MYETVPHLTVTNVSPVFGAVEGATVVTVTGVGFLVKSTLRCRFGTVYVLASYVSATEVVCVAPEQQATGTVTVSVSVNNYHFSLDVVQFTYHESPIVASVTPAVGPTLAGTNVTIVGSFFIDNADARCRFGSAGVEVVPNSITASAMVCTTPATDASVVSVEVSNNGVDWSASNVRFGFTAVPTTSAIDPPVVLSETITMLFVQGAAFVDSTLLLCTFDEFTGEFLYTNATFVSATLVRCASPRFSFGKTSALVHVTNNVALLQA